MEGGKGRQRRGEERREGFDLDVWLQQPARDGVMRVKKRRTDREGGGVKCSGDQIADRVIVADMEGDGGGDGGGGMAD